MNRIFTTLTAISCVCLIAANIFEAKIFALGPLTLTGGFLIFPLSYIINDIISEIFGYKSSRFVVLLAFALNAAFLLGIYIVRLLPPVPYCDAQDHLDYFFATDLRISIASVAAFVGGSLMNAKVLTAMKRRQGEKGFGWRAIVSSLAGESVDSLVFFPIAFHALGMKNIMVLMLTQIVLKTMYELIVLPLTSFLVGRIKRAEWYVSAEKA